MREVARYRIVAVIDGIKILVSYKGKQITFPPVPPLASHQAIAALRDLWILAHGSDDWEFQLDDPDL